MNYETIHYARLLESCRSPSSVLNGKQLHQILLKKGIVNSALAFANRLLQMYVCCSSMDDARKQFDEMPQRNCFSWNTMVESYLKLGEGEKSVELFNLIPFKNDYSWNVVVSGFVKAGNLEVARGLFDQMPKKNGLIWNSMIHGYARNGCLEEAIRLFKDFNLNAEEQFKTDPFVLATVIRACTDLLALACGKQIHARIIVAEVEFDSVLATSLINLYGKCGDLDSANQILNLLKEHDDFSLSALISGYASNGRMGEAMNLFESSGKTCVVQWNSMISGCVSNNEEMKALALFNEMRRDGIREDPSTFASILSACSSLVVLECVEQMHGLLYRVGVLDDVIIAAALLDAYSKCGSFRDACDLFSEVKAYDTILLNTMITVFSNCGRIEEAKRIFDIMRNKSLVSWNSMLAGFSRNGCPVDALDLFFEMNKMNLRMDKFTLASAVSACASISTPELGEQIFARATVLGLEYGPIVSTSLVDFYCKCGYVKNGRKVFDEMVKPDRASYNSMLMGYAANGHAIEALDVFREMRDAGVGPTGVTLLGVLSACDHCGIVEEGWKWFSAMKRDYDIDPGIEHYSCMIDLFARAGFLGEAIDLIEQMPYEADASMWSSVLRGCVAHGEKALGQKVAMRIIELEPENSAAYVQLSSVFASSGEWERCELIRKLMKSQQIQKNPGYSWADC